MSFLFSFINCHEEVILLQAYSIRSNYWPLLQVAPHLFRLWRWGRFFRISPSTPISMKRSRRESSIAGLLMGMSLKVAKWRFSPVPSYPSSTKNTRVSLYRVHPISACYKRSQIMMYEPHNSFVSQIKIQALVTSRWFWNFQTLRRSLLPPPPVWAFRPLDNLTVFLKWTVTQWFLFRTYFKGWWSWISKDQSRAYPWSLVSRSTWLLLKWYVGYYTFTSAHCERLKLG